MRTALNVIKFGFTDQTLALRHLQSGGDIDLPKKNDEPTMKALDEDQVQVFVGALVGDTREAVLQTALASGARPGEYLALRWPDLNTMQEGFAICLGYADSELKNLRLEAAKRGYFVAVQSRVARL